MDDAVLSSKKERLDYRISIDLGNHDWLLNKLKKTDQLPNVTMPTGKFNSINKESNASNVIMKRNYLSVPFPVKNSMDESASINIATKISHARKNTAATVEIKPKANAVETQTDDVFFVNKDDNEILQIIKSHAVSKEILSNIVQTLKDINNQIGDESNSRQEEGIEVIDENSNEGNDQLVIDEGVLNTLLNHSEKNKAIIYEHYGDVNKSKDDVNKKTKSEIIMKNKTAKVSVINETIQLLEKIAEDILAPSPVLLNANTQTETDNAIKNVILSHDQGRELYFANLTQSEYSSSPLNVKDSLNLHKQSQQLLQQQNSQNQQQNQSQSNSYPQRQKRQKQQHNKKHEQQNTRQRQLFQQFLDSQQRSALNQKPFQRQSQMENGSNKYSPSTMMPQLQPIHAASPTQPHYVYPGDYSPAPRGTSIRPEDPLFFERALQHINVKVPPGWSQNLPSNAVRAQFDQTGQKRQQLIEQQHQQQVYQHLQQQMEIQRQQQMDQQLQQQVEQQRQQQIDQQLQQQLEEQRQRQMEQQLQQQMAHQHQQQMEEQRKQQIIQQRQLQRRSEQQKNCQIGSQQSTWDLQLLNYPI